MNRFPIRIRLTAAFALAMTSMLVGAGIWVFVQVRAGLDETLDEGLQARAGAVAELARQSGKPDLTGRNAQESEEAFIQLLTSNGQVIAAEGGIDRPALQAGELPRAGQRTVLIEHRYPGIEGTARVFAQPVSKRPGAPVVVVGQSLADRDEVLAGLVAAFAVGGPLALVAASAAGYAIATAGLAPVEAMRRRAAEVSLGGDDATLPVPAAQDEINRLARTLNDMLDRLRRSFERERRFVADASHELRTPVAVVKTELETALRTGEYGPRVRESLVAAVEECDHLAQLAEDLLLVARAAEGRLPVRRERLDLAPALQGIVERFADRAAQRARSIRVDADPVLVLSADLLSLRQAVGNLVDNALRHGDGDIVIAARRGDARVEVEVHDEGPGFATDFAEHAFDRFARGDLARTREAAGQGEAHSGGVGLGLAIVRTIARAHGGEAEIVPGHGATVRIWLADDQQSIPGQG